MNGLINHSKALAQPANQRGAALIMAMLVVSLVAVLAVGLSGQQFIMIKRASNQIAAEHAQGYLRAAEDIALGLMNFRLQEKSDVDNCGFFLNAVQGYSIDEGGFEGSLLDLSGRFNINNLALGLKDNATVPYTADQARFQRLLMSFDGLDISQSQSVEITEAVIDWLDADSNSTGFGGAETPYYEALDDIPPYRAANTKMHSVSELLLVRGMTPALYEQLRFHVTVWPLVGGDDLNVNTASPNVLRSLNVPVVTGQQSMLGNPIETAEILPLLQRQIDLGGWTTAADFNQDFQNFGFAAADVTGLGVKSKLALLQAAVRLGDYTSMSYAVVSREGGNARIIHRVQSGEAFNKWCELPKEE